MALGAGGAVGGVGDILGNDCYVTLLKWDGLPENFNKAGVRVADADFQTVVEMLASAGDIRYLPEISRQKKYGKMHRKIIVPVFSYNTLCFCHAKLLKIFLYNLFNLLVKKLSIIYIPTKSNKINHESSAVKGGLFIECSYFFKFPFIIAKKLRQIAYKKTKIMGQIRQVFLVKALTFSINVRFCTVYQPY